MFSFLLCLNLSTSVCVCAFVLSISLQAPSVAPKVKEEATASPSTVPGSVLWVDKYKPRDLKHIIGQQGNRSNMNKLLQWLKAWDKTRSYSGMCLGTSALYTVPFTSIC